MAVVLSLIQIRAIEIGFLIMRPISLLLLLEATYNGLGTILLTFPIGL